MVGLQATEQRVVAQPELVVVVDEGVEIGPHCRRRPACEAPRGLGQQCGLERDQRAVIDGVVGQGRQGCEFLGVEQAEGHEVRHVDQHFIARERGQRLIRRVTVRRGPERQELPHAEPHGTHGLDKVVRGRTDFADAEGPRK